MARLAAFGRLVRGALFGMIAAAACAPALAQPALWAVKDADSTVYMLGTGHLQRPERDWHSDKLDAALAQAKVLWPAQHTKASAGVGGWHVRLCSY